MLDYLKEELKLNYLDLCKHLQDKYGVPSGNYFLTDSCKSKNNKITRGNDGLLIHHIKENVAINLCNKEFAINMPFEYQEGQNLVYCDYLEHLILHMKIVQEYLTMDTFWANTAAVGIGGLNNFILPEINDFFNGYEYSRDWQIKALKMVDKTSYDELKKMAYDICMKNEVVKCSFERQIIFDTPLVNKDVFLNYKGKMTDKNYQEVKAKREEHKKRYAEDEEYRKEYDKMAAERIESIKKILEARKNKDK